MNNELLNECKGPGEMLRGINVIHTHAHQSSVSINQLTPTVQTSTIEEDHNTKTIKKYESLRN